MEFFGNARPLGTLNWGITDAISWQSSPSNQDLYVLNSTDGSDYDLGVGREENEFTSSNTDKISLGMPLPIEMDTGCALILEIYYHLSSSSAGNINWKTSKGITAIGEGVGGDTTAAPSTIRDYEITNNILPVAINSNDKMQYFSTKMYFSKAIARKLSDNSSDILTIVINRDGPDSSDTYAGNASIYQVRAKFYKWSQGGYRL